MICREMKPFIYDIVHMNNIDYYNLQRSFHRLHFQIKEPKQFVSNCLCFQNDLNSFRIMY